MPGSNPAADHVAGISVESGAMGLRAGPAFAGGAVRDALLTTATPAVR
jgi:hypothetical protein